MPQEIRAWMKDRSWGDHHLQWHIERWWYRLGAAQQRRYRRRGWSEADRQEGDPGNGWDFLAMHRVMMRMLIKAFPAHADLFRGWETPPTNPYDPDEEVPGGAPFPAARRFAVTVIENEPERFADDDAFGLYVQTQRNQSLRGAGIHNWLHARWRGIDPEIDLGNPMVNMENTRFWRLHGWIDAQWTRFREAKGLSDDQPEYLAALAAAKAMMTGHTHGGHHELLQMISETFATSATEDAMRSMGSTLREALGPVEMSASFQAATLAPAAPDPTEPLDRETLLSFDTAEVVPGIVNGTWFLVVHGFKPYANMSVELRPAVYVKRPDWWSYAVVGVLDGVGLPKISEYTTAIPIHDATGHEGVEVCGNDRALRLPVSLNQARP